MYFFMVIRFARPVREDTGGHFLTLPMEITKTDLLKTIAYLDDAAKIYDAMPKPRHRWRAVLIRRLNIKLKKLLEDGKD